MVTSVCVATETYLFIKRGREYLTHFSNNNDNQQQTNAAPEQRKNARKKKEREGKGKIMTWGADIRFPPPSTSQEHLLTHSQSTHFIDSDVGMSAPFGLRVCRLPRCVARPLSPSLSPCHPVR